MFVLTNLVYSLWIVAVGYYAAENIDCGRELKIRLMIPLKFRWGIEKLQKKTCIITHIIIIIKNTGNFTYIVMKVSKHCSTFVLFLFWGGWIKKKNTSKVNLESDLILGS